MTKYNNKVETKDEISVMMNGCWNVKNGPINFGEISLVIENYVATTKCNNTKTIEKMTTNKYLSSLEIKNFELINDT